MNINLDLDRPRRMKQLRNRKIILQSARLLDRVELYSASGRRLNYHVGKREDRSALPPLSIEHVTDYRRR